MQDPKPHRWERKAQERPAALFDAALKAFGTAGFRATRLEDIAEAAGVSKGTIYNYFTNKNDLLLQAFEYRIQLRMDEMQAILAGFEGTSEARLCLVMTTMWERWQCEHWARLQRFILGEASIDFPELFEMWAQKGPINLWDYLETVLDEGKANGEFRADLDSATAARFLVSGLSQQALFNVHFKIEKHMSIPPSRILAGTLDVFLHGIRTQPLERIIP